MRKLLQLVKRPSLWQFAARGTVPSLEHLEVSFEYDFATVIDVGASRGQFASFAAHRFPDARLICFEPLEEPANTLKSALGRRVELRRVALGSEAGESEIHISARDDSSSLLPIGERQIAEFPGTAAVETRTIRVSTLDLELPDDLMRPCLLKIDVQGLEAEVLKGGRELLGQVDEALIECSFVELYGGQALAPTVIGLMEAEGFSLVGKSEAVTSASGEDLQADLLFRRN